MDYLTREFKNLYYAYQLFKSIENKITEHILTQLPHETKKMVNSIKINDCDKGNLELILYVFTENLDMLYISLKSLFKDLNFKKELNPNFSYIVLQLDDDFIDNILF